jgi:NADH:ubiquinone reductase (H+-translocating)
MFASKEALMSTDAQPRAVVIGAGFGGLAATRALANSRIHVTLVDRNNYHTFLPLLYQVAAAELEATDISYPVRTILRGLPSARFSMAEVLAVDLSSRLVLTDGPDFSYDYLVLATGSVPQYFGVEGAADFAFPLYSLPQGMRLRSHILRCFERATQTPEAEARRRMLTCVIVGGGPTGVEYAGALAELTHGPLIKDYPVLDPREVRIIVLEAGDSLLPSLPAKLRAYAGQRLQRMKVEVHLRAAVTRITSDAARLHDGTIIPADTVVWTAGVHGDPRVQDWGLPTGRGGLVTVLPTLQVPGFPEVYAVGDLALLDTDGLPLPMVAPVAVEEGRFAASNIVRQVRGEELRPFRYRDKGSMVTLGRNAGVAQIGRWSFSGFPAWAAWLLVHLIKLIGFRNRMAVLLNWAWDYFFFERAARLILEPAPLPEAGRDSQQDSPL